MDMSLEYLVETIAHLDDIGFETKRIEVPELTYVATRFEVTHDNIKISVEHLNYVDDAEDERYWIHIENYFGLESMPFELDSWKYRDTKTEFRFFAKPDGTALTFSLVYERIPVLG